MRSYSVAVLLIAVLVTIFFFKKDDLIEARGGRGGGSRSSGSSYRSSSSRYSRSSSSSYSDRRRTGVYDSRRRTDYSRRRSSWDSSSDYDYSRRRSYYNSGTDYGSTGSSGGGGLSTGAILGIVFGVGGLCLLVYCCKHCNDTGGTGTVYTTPAYDAVGPSTNITPAETAPTGYTPVLPSDPTGPVGYSTHQSPAFFSMGTTPSGPTQAHEAPPLPSQYPSSQQPPAPYPPATYPTYPDSGIQDAPTSGPYDQPGMQAPPLPLPPQISEELDNDDGGMSMGGYPPSAVPPALPTYPSSSTVPPPPTVAPPVETVDDPSMHVSAPADAPPPSYNDLFKS